MPTQTRQPVWTWRDAVRQADIPPLTKLVCWALANYITDLGEGCFPSVEALMRDTGLSNRSVSTHTANAVAAGLLEIDKRAAPGGKFTLNVYMPRFPDHCDLVRPGDERGRNAPREGGSRGKNRVKDIHAADATPPLPREGASHGETCSPREPDDIHRVNLLHTNTSIGTIHSSPLPPAGGREREGDIQFDNRFSAILDGLRAEHDTIVRTFLGPVVELVQISHANPALLLETVAKDLAGTPATVLAEAAKVARQTRKKMISPKCFADCVAVARRTAADAGVAGDRHTVTRDGHREQWAAWRRWAEGNARGDRQARALVNVMRISGTIIVDTAWPPSQGQTETPGAETTAEGDQP